MTVELAKPFQWPEVPKDLEPWSNELWKLREKQSEKQNEEQLQKHQFKIPLKSSRAPSKDRKELGDLAKKMLTGEVEWKNDVKLDPKWDKILEQKGKSTPAAEKKVSEETTQPQ
jgi:large subunit ribosomal protein L23